ncbi:MAG TPA: ABC transporter permease subunit [Vicinamibacterales bacterium]|jgi:ABC-2 type transport system permease protein
MRNTLAIAHKELRSYFASPIGYVVIGFFALLYGFFYSTYLTYFVGQSMQAAQFGGGEPMNVNQMMIRPALQNITILLLFLMPMITMRSYSEEKRSGTMELLLTSPITDLEIILGKFLGALALWVAALAVTLIHIALLFYFGNPEWKPIVTAYLGLVLMGGCFISLGLLISSLTSNQIVAGMATFGVFLLFWVINWIGSFSGPTVDKITKYISIIDHFDDFGKGIIDTSHLIYYISFISFGLFLTAKSVDSERWRG